MKKIITVEDNTDNLEVLKYLLESEGYEVYPDVSGTIIDNILTINPDLIIMDVWLPIIDGDKICRQIKTNPETAHIPVILMSAEICDQDKFSNSLADAYLEKPYEIKTIISMAKKYVR